MKQEKERKYLVKYLPKDLNIKNTIDIEQAFIYIDKKTIVRIREIKNTYLNKKEYIYTVKTKGDIEYNKGSSIAKVYEIESNIQQSEYNELMKNKISNIIKKTRIVIGIQDNLNIELDIYYEYLEGFLTAEIEFPNENIANHFIKPEWLGEEIGYKELSNWKLSNMTKTEWIQKIKKEIIENNREIIHNLKMNYNI